MIQLSGINTDKKGLKFGGWFTKNGTDTGEWGEEYLNTAKIYADTVVYAKWKADDTDCLANITLTALSGTAGNSGESYDKLVDGKKISGNHTKWCVQSTTSEVILKASAYTIPIGYTLTTGNDTQKQSGRNPKDWVLYACNEYDERNQTGSWTAIAIVENDAVMVAYNYKSYDFPISNTKAYKYFKFKILSVKSGITIQVSNPVTETEESETISAQIGVTVETGTKVVAVNNTDYKEYFTSDYVGGILKYDQDDKIVKLFVTVTFDCGNENTFTETVERGTAVAEPTPLTIRNDNYFGGWYIGNIPYDFTTAISQNTIIAAKWLKDDEFAISITPSKIYIVSGNTNATAYGAIYKGTQLIDVEIKNVASYTVITLNELNLNFEDADTVSLFVRDENLSPLCNNLSLSLPQ